MTHVSGQEHTFPHPTAITSVERMRQTSPSSLLFFCLVVFQFFTPVFVQAQGARVRQANASADKERNRADTEERDSDADNPQGRQEWFRGGRHEAGEHAADLLRRAYGQKRQMRAVSPGSGQSAMTLSNTSPGATTANGIPFNGQTFLGTWSNLGPAPIGSDPGQDYGKVVGRVTSVVVDQGDGTGNTVYIGAAFGGVWKSSNAAASDPTTVTWTPLIDDQPTLAVGAVTVQPTNSNVVLVGTGESNSSGDSYYGMGILRSTDAGKTWNLVKSADNGVKAFAGLGTSSFAWSTDTPNLVVLGMASTNGRRYGSDSVGGRGIYYSQDAGATWHYATVQDPGGATLSEGTVTALAFSPATHKFYAFYRYHGFYESADAVNWTRSAFQPSSTGALNVTNCPSNQPAPNPTGNCPLYRGQIAVQPSTHDMYVIYVNDSDTHQGVFVTSNGATTAWRELNSKGSAGLVDTASTNTIEQGDYNLWLGAVPSVQGTDLLVGTRNIYKCSLAAGGDCATWLDLTHVYTCNPIASPSHVHPDQHGFDFSVAHPTVMYFANDGGVYRTLNGTAVSTGACTSPNPFDNLDANMGSLSEMVSFSQHPTNRNVLLGGLQDNGSTALLGSGAPFWQTVNGGDGGFNEIDPNNPDGIWYATNTGVSIQQCNATNKQPPPNGPGIPNAESCNPGTFGAAPYPAAGPNIGPSHVANDSAEFYMPYIFDPANTSNLIVGTCRLWRGPGVGGSTWLDASSVANKDISPAFDNTASLPCAAGSTKVRAIAAGGPAPNGISQVIYVGLEGAGTFNASGGNLAHVFVNTRADINTGTHGAANGWTDVTANIGA
ncbi:MAG TPA: sialidase family protein, partial [Terriglobales bacterium]|nr:sialidase family protein [Terriglobales bacterium]